MHIYLSLDPQLIAASDDDVWSKQVAVEKLQEQDGVW